MTWPLCRWVAAAALLVAVTGGCTSGDANPETEPAAPSARPSPELVEAAGRVCVDAKDELTALGASVTSGAAGQGPDPLMETLIRPGTSIYQRQADEFRTLIGRLDPTQAVETYLGYFEIIDALLNARLLVGQPGGPAIGDARSLEARFQVMATEQAQAARDAGLSACDFDATDIIFGQ